MGFRNVGLVVVGLVASLNLGCTPCGPFARRPESVCVPSDGGAIEGGQPFVLTATVTASSAAEAKCAVVVDGGVIEIIVSGEECRQSGGPFGAKPIAIKGVAECAVPALEAGQYTVRGVTPSFDVVVNVGGDAGAGVPVCP